MNMFFVLLMLILSVEAQIAPNQQLKCRICNRATALSDCQTQAVCDNTKEKCYMDEIITDQLTVVFTGGCRSKYVCDQVTAVGKRQDLTACTKCCDSDDCNKVLCGIKNDLINNSQCYFCEGRDQSNPQSDVINPKDCVTMTTCQSDEVCYTGEEGFGGDSSHFHYGCHNKRTCLTLMNVAYKDYHICETNTTQPPGGVTWYEYCGDQRYHKRSRYVCHSCCNYPSCNYGSCHEQNDEPYITNNKNTEYYYFKERKLVRGELTSKKRLSSFTNKEIRSKSKST